MNGLADVGVVAIGRNEGERLRRCLNSVIGKATRVVYVDSGSSDGSVAMARAAGAEVVELDLSRPFTAARARNAGLERLVETAPDAAFVQFVDGDCEVVKEWLEAARAEMEARPEAVIVCGRRRERFPERSVYNRLCDMEWDTPIGETTFCGGDAMMRIEAVRSVGGFNPAIIAGEEPDLCIRLMDRGGRIFRIDRDMTLHDAAMTRFSQWWRRSVRAGHAYAEGAALHGRTPLKHWVKQRRRAWMWGAAAPLAALALAWPTRGLSVAALVAVYGLLWLRTYRSRRARGAGARAAAEFALFCTLAKVPEAVGQVKHLLRKASGRTPTIIEYKGAAAA